MFTKKNQTAELVTARTDADGEAAVPSLATVPLPLSNSAAGAQTTAPPQPRSKRALVIELLRREDGATLPELMAATGWQAHSVRAVLTGLRKTGFVLDKSIRAGATSYQILEASDGRS